jgi:hypothetical protein
VTTADPGRHLPDRTGAREQALAREASDVQARIDGLTACQQILTAFTGPGRPLRARDPCAALDLPIASRNAGNICSKLKRLASRGILIGTEPGLPALPRPWCRIRQRLPATAAGSRAQQAPERCQVRGISQLKFL